jgi:hypothetical protein
MGTGGREYLVSEALVGDDGCRLVGPDSIGLLTTSEWDALEAAVGETFLRICPISGVTNAQAWIALLKTGAKQNPVQQAQIALCFDPIVGSKKVAFVQRPDRYFQKPLNELLDGHMMVFRAVHDLIDP